MGDTRFLDLAGPAPLALLLPHGWLAPRATQALTMLIIMARDRRPHGLAELARRRGVTYARAHAMFDELARAGLVERTPASPSSFTLAIPASEISVAQVVRAIEWSSVRSAVHHDAALAPFYAEVERFLSGITLASISAPPAVA